MRLLIKLAATTKQQLYVQAMMQDEYKYPSLTGDHKMLVPPGV